MTDAEHLAQHLTPLDADGVLALGDLSRGLIERAPIFLIDRLTKPGKLDGRPTRWRGRIPLARQQGSTFGLTPFGKEVYAALNTARAARTPETRDNE